MKEMSYVDHYKRLEAECDRLRAGLYASEMTIQRLYERLAQPHVMQAEEEARKLREKGADPYSEPPF